MDSPSTDVTASPSKSQRPSETNLGPSSPDKTVPQNLYDIALFVKKPLSDDEKYNILKKCFKPHDKYNFMLTKFGKQQRAFNHDWLRRYPGLVYSPSLNGASLVPSLDLTVSKRDL